MIFVTVISGCGGSQPAVEVPTAAQQRRQAGEPGRDLLYVTGYPSTNVYTYPKGRLLSVLRTNGFAACSDTAGHVFITNAYGVAEYAHGRATQIAFLNGPFGSVHSCSADPTTGDLAVTSASTAGYGIGIYRPGARHQRWHLPRVYPTAQYPVSCAYDSSGDLFVDATLSDVTYLLELPKGSTNFQQISFMEKITNPGYIQWDGRYLAIADDDRLIVHRVAVVGGKTRRIGSLKLRQAKEIEQFWIRGNLLVNPDALSGFVGFWRYPKGGAPLERIDMKSPLGATVSLK